MVATIPAEDIGGTGAECSSDIGGGTCSSDAGRSRCCQDGVPCTETVRRVPTYHGGNLNEFIGSGSRPGSSSSTSDDEGIEWPKQTAASYERLSAKIERHVLSGDRFFSLEFFPPRTANGVANLIARMDSLGEGGPLFCDITWHTAGDPGSDKVTSSTSIAKACLDICQLETMLHVCCRGYTREQVLKHVQTAKKLGLRNILALRGDFSGPGVEQSPFQYAVDFVRLIRQEFGDHFVIGVAGYPTGHPEAASYDADLLNLKAKVDAGADFVITQLFFRAEQFTNFVRDCRQIGIQVPILPGIMPIQSYESLRHIAKLSQLEVPKFISEAIEPIRQNDEAIRNYGVELATQLTMQVLESGAPGVHFYTLNREIATREILRRTGLWRSPNIPRVLPWRKRHPSHPKRCREDVRPIFWSSRPKSYIYRTKDWDDFPNGRWGHSDSAAFGELKDYYMFYGTTQHTKNDEDSLNMWGDALKDEKDVWHVFECFVSGKENRRGVKVIRLPWSEQDSIQSEFNLLKDSLMWANRHGILTINSQPAVNGAPSNDPVVGWGAPGGYVYQKAYLEFFTSRENAEQLLKLLPGYATVNYHIINYDGTFNHTNNTQVNAVTWGVFPGAEIQQPTVVDPASFLVWKEEAFSLWLTGWARLYETAHDCTSQSVIQRIHDSYCLVNLVDNAYPATTCIWELVARMLEERLVRN